MELFNEIKSILMNLNIEKLSLLFQLTENYCKSEHFTFDCLSEHLIQPLARSADNGGSGGNKDSQDIQELKKINNNISDLVYKHKKRIEKFLKASIDKKAELQNYKYITEENLNLEDDTSGNTSKTTSKFGKTFSNSSENQLTGDILNISKSNSLPFREYLKILMFIYDTCTEECRNLLDFLFMENYGIDYDRINLEMIGKLFNLGQNYKDKIDKNELIEKSENTSYIKYNSKPYPINDLNSQILKYKNWTARMTIVYLYRYFILEKSFFNEIIMGNIPNSVLIDMFYYNQEQSLLDNDYIKVIRIIPLIRPYSSFAETMYKIIRDIFKQWYKISHSLNTSVSLSKKAINSFYKLNQSLLDQINLNIYHYKKYIINQAQDLHSKYKTYKKLYKDSSHNTENTEKDISLIISNQSFFNLLDYIKNLIYDFKGKFNLDCHKFLNVNYYFHKEPVGKPIRSFIAVGYNTRFFKYIEPEVNLMYIYGMVNFNMNKGVESNWSTAGNPSNKYMIHIQSSAIIELLINEQVNTEYTPRTPVEDAFFKNLHDYFYYIPEIKEQETLYIEIKIKMLFNEIKGIGSNYWKYIEFEIKKEEEIKEELKKERKNSNKNSKVKKKKVQQNQYRIYLLKRIYYNIQKI